MTSLLFGDCLNYENYKELYENGMMLSICRCGHLEKNHASTYKT